MKTKTATKAIQSNVTTATAAPTTLNAVTLMEVTPASNLPEIMIVCKKTDSGTVTHHNANIADVIRPAELLLASAVKVNLCYNLMSGRVSPAILKAAKDGTLTALLGDKDDQGNVRTGIDKSDLTALKKLLNYSPAQIVAQWNLHAENAKRITKPSLQGMIAAFNIKAENEVVKMTLKEALAKWAEDNTELLTANVGLADIFIEYKVTAE